MRSLLASIAVAATLVLMGCSGEAKDAVGSAVGAAQSAASSAAADGGSPADGPSQSLDCGALTKDDVSRFIVYTQLIAQATDLDALNGLRQGGVTDYTPDAMKQVLDRMDVLRGHPAPGQPDPAEALDYFQKANTLLAAVFAADADPSPAQADELKAAIVDVPTALKNQLTINLSLAATCTGLA
ncbi:MAG: hypothetical protein AB7V23_02150 [Candidatus Nanopelagicales bacterium]